MGDDEEARSYGDKAGKEGRQAQLPGHEGARRRLGGRIPDSSGLRGRKQGRGGNELSKIFCDFIDNASQLQLREEGFAEATRKFRALVSTRLSTSYEIP